MNGQDTKQNSPVIQLNNVSKVYKIKGEKCAICNGVNFKVQPGEFIILEGENGSGKSTLLKLILGLEFPDSGNVRLWGESPQLASSKLRVGTTLQKAKPIDSLTVEELVNLFRSYYPQPLDMEEILNRTKLQEKRKDKAIHLSGGQEQALYFALAIAGNPDLLLLDEPTRNLDKNASQQFWQQVGEFAKQGKTIIAVSHNQSDREIMENMATRVLKIENGSLQEEILSSPLTSEPAISASTTETNKIPFAKAFWSQMQVERLDLLRKPGFILSIFAFSLLPLLFPEEDAGTLKNYIILLAGFNLFLIALQSFSMRIATERVQGWITLLKATPLPAWVYIAAKVTAAFVVAVFSLAIILGIGASKLGNEATIGFFIQTFLGLSLGIIPFAILGFAIGYLLEPKATSMVTVFVLLLAMATIGVPFSMLPYSLQSAIAFSPFYHYGQVVAAAADLQISPNADFPDVKDGHFFLHVLWLVWTGIAASLLAIWSYQRDRVSG
ncbi:ABC transporter ATP-binding protein/permease [Geitlerinema sp. PCC 9228]|uniref:ABC transporter ATP-binding protein/permease n=1 Tax=Geitlerinema sp. PCC 9228 TaxID=111611 RepID=UPI0008F993DC|nr:ABC transporter ATP-binding protein/permease [Geitlerinema sp. PCC 9228]